MSNELNTPKILYCPSEYQSVRSQATTWLASLTGGNPLNLTFYISDLNVSYFIGVDADENNPQMFLTGDHNIGLLQSGNPPTSDLQHIYGDTLPYLAALNTNAPAAGGAAKWVGWGDNGHGKVGNIAMTDGSASTYTVPGLQSALVATADINHTDSAGFGAGGMIGGATASSSRPPSKPRDYPVSNLAVFQQRRPNRAPFTFTQCLDPAVWRIISRSGVIGRNPTAAASFPTAGLRRCRDPRPGAQPPRFAEQTGSRSWTRGPRQRFWPGQECSLLRCCPH